MLEAFSCSVYMKNRKVETKNEGVRDLIPENIVVLLLGKKSCGRVYARGYQCVQRGPDNVDLLTKERKMNFI